ncbi:MAG: DUF1588 domain-containing protein [Thermoguttaceae bacterium]
MQRSLLDYLKCLLGLAFFGLSTTPTLLAAVPGTGDQVYKTRCADCHGHDGQGVADEYERPLEGSLSVAQLAELIGQTMPADDPGTLSTDESHAVAAYIHGTFYSPVARERKRPPRIELARLTVRQYRQTVADLVGSFRGPVHGTDRRGLDAEYFRGRSMDRKSSAARRVDPQVDFDFGTGAPLAEIAEPREFSVRWQGSLLAPDTGAYELVVRTAHAVRLWLNDLDAPVVDRWVKSGDQEEFRAELFLTGGRIYPLRLEFSKAKQGVDDSDKQKEKPPSAPASITLLWRPPRGALEPIPPRLLSPDSAPEQFVCTVPFPPDDRSYGWERGTSVSAAWERAVTEAAVEAANYVADQAAQLAGARQEAPDYREKLQAFCRTFCERAFRGPLEPDDVEFFVNRQFQAAGDPAFAVKRVVLLALSSPRFLFREVGTNPAPWDVAARLSFALWDSIPDEVLRQAAADDRLATTDQVARQARRMLADYRAQSKLRGFLLTWLQADLDKDLGKDTQAYPGFDAQTIAHLRSSLELSLDEVLSSDEADYRRLVLADEIYVNQRLAGLFGVEAPAQPGFAKARIDDGRRAGVLTHPYLMASLAYARESSPIHRGVFLARSVLGQALRPPPVAVAPLAPDLHPDMTTRRRVATQTSPAECMTCHSIINPLGFALENFDAVGRYRRQERNQPVDPSGSYHTRQGQTVSFRGARQLAEFVAGSPEAHSAFTEQLFHHLVQQPARAYGSNTLDRLRDKFVAGNFNIRSLALEIVTLSAPVGREPPLPQDTASRPGS